MTTIMKGSGIEWIGKIPSTWETSKIKHLTKVRKESNLYNPEADEYIGLENIASYSNSIVLTDLKCEASTQNICCKGDLLFGKLRPYLAKVLIAPYDAFCTGEFLVFSQFDGDMRFFRYFLLSAGFLDYVNSSTYGAKMPRVNSGFILNSKIVYPNKVQQTKIADFLDDNCKKIDKIVSDTKTIIEDYKKYKQSLISEVVTKGLNPNVEMTDNRVDWIDRVPSHWSLFKSKNIFTQRNSRGNETHLELLSPTQKYGVIPQSLYEEYSGMSAVKLKEDYDLTQLKTIHKGDYCISLRSFQGGFEYSNYEGVVSPAYQVFYPKQEISDGYFRYLFKENRFIQKMNSYAISLRDGKNISFEDFGNTFIPVPPYQEQILISNFLDSKCAEIDKLIVAKEALIEDLKAYKKSLIYEYVTGKKEVI